MGEVIHKIEVEGVPHYAIYSTTKNAYGSPFFQTPEEVATFASEEPNQNQPYTDELEERPLREIWLEQASEAETINTISQEIIKKVTKIISSMKEEGREISDEEADIVQNIASLAENILATSHVEIPQKTTLDEIAERIGIREEYDENWDTESILGTSKNRSYKLKAARAKENTPPPTEREIRFTGEYLEILLQELANKTKETRDQISGIIPLDATFTQITTEAILDQYIIRRGFTEEGDQISILGVEDKGDFIEVETGPGCSKTALLDTMRKIAQEQNKTVKAPFKDQELVVEPETPESLDDLTPTKIADALKDLIEEDEYDDIAECKDGQDALGAAYTILLTYEDEYGKTPDQIFEEQGITEPEEN